MRISEKRINRIARKVTELLMQDKETRKLVDAAVLESEVKVVIYADLREEDAIEEEAKKLLEDELNRTIFNKDLMDYQALLRRAIKQVAREKDFIL